MGDAGTGRRSLPENFLMWADEIFYSRVFRKNSDKNLTNIPGL
jgi:hypothetical protein